MKLLEDLKIGRVTVISLLKTIFLILLTAYLQSCIMEKSDLKILIINRSKSNVYIGPIYDCDTCEIKRDIRLHCSYKNNYSQMRVLKMNDSILLVDKLVSDNVKSYVMDVDSLDSYCGHAIKDRISNKSWIKIVSGNVDQENKTCKIIIN